MAEEITQKEPKKPKPLSIPEKIGHWIVILICAGFAAITILVAFSERQIGPEQIFILLFFLLFVISTTRIYSHRLFVPIDRQKYLGSRPALSLVALVLVGMGTVIIYPQFHTYCCARPVNSDTKSNLHNLYLGCKAYWAEKGSEQICDVSTVATQEYGYVQSTRVSIYGKGPETTFTATAQHLDSTTQYTMDANGNIE